MRSVAPSVPFTSGEEQVIEDMVKYYDIYEVLSMSRAEGVTISRRTRDRTNV